MKRVVLSFVIALICNLGFAQELTEIKESIYENLSKSKDHTKFLEVAKIVGLDEMLKLEKGGYTVFAFNNKAYKESQMIQKLMAAKQIDLLKNILLNHIVSEPLGPQIFLASEESLEEEKIIRNVKGVILNVRELKGILAIYLEGHPFIPFEIPKNKYSNGYWYDTHRVIGLI